MVPGNAYGKKGFVQKLSGRPHQGASVVILHAAGALAYNHERRIGRACGQHGPQAPFPAKGTAAAASDGRRQGLVGRIGHDAGA